LDSETHHSIVAAATADPFEGVDSVLAAVDGGGVSADVSANGVASYPLMLSIEWESAAEESDVITDSVGNGRALPFDVLEEAQDSAANRVVSPYSPS